MAVVEQGNMSDLTQWRALLQTRRPVLVHLNADTTWLLQLPVPSPQQRTHFNLLIDPWLQGPQSDVAPWFSTQWHVVASSVRTLAELNSVLAALEDRAEEATEPFIDAVAVSHEFTDHCHQPTLQELPRTTPVFATEVAAQLIRSWQHFDTVITTPGWQDARPDPPSPLPPWLGIGRIVTAGDSLYYHSALLIVFSGEAIVYTPHGVLARDLEGVRESGVKTLALLHGLHDVRIWMAAQLNLGALNGIRAARACGAEYWVATHDEVKRGGGIIGRFLRRTRYTLRDAVEAEEASEAKEGSAQKQGRGYRFVDLGSGGLFRL